jgi:transcriptional regulator with XRE-family HTH domain
MEKHEMRRDRAAHLREVRRQAGFTVSEVAKEARLDRSTISTYEARRASASPRALTRWEVALSRLVRERRARLRTAMNSLEDLGIEAA